MRKRVKRMTALLMLAVFILSGCQKNAAVSDSTLENISATVTPENGKDAVGRDNTGITVYSEGENELAIYSGFEYSIESDENISISGATAQNGDDFYFTAYQKNADETHSAVMGHVDFQRLAEISNGQGQPGSVKKMESSPDDIVEYIPLEEVAEWAVNKVYVNDDNIFLLCFNMIDNEFVYYIYTMTKDGQTVSSFDVTEAYNSLGDCTGIMVQQYNTGEKYYYLELFEGKKSSFIVFDEKGEQIDEKSLPYYVDDMCLTEDNRVIFATSETEEGDGKRIMEYVPGKEVRRIALVEGVNTYISLCSYEGETYFKSRQGIYCCDSSESEYNMILKWSDAGMASGAEQNVKNIADGRLAGGCATPDKKSNLQISLLYLEKTDVQYSAERQKVVLGVSVKAGDALEYLIRLFNNFQGIYEVVTKEYTWSYDRTEQLGTELITGNGPDLISTVLFDIEEYAAIGMVEDLKGYLASSEELSEDMLVESIVEAYTVDGCLAAIPNVFAIDAYWGRGQYIGEGAAWTFDQLINCVENNRGCEIGGFGHGYDTKKYLVMLDWQANQSSYVDWQSFEAHFDTPEFVELLEYVSKYEVTKRSAGLDVVDVMGQGINLLYDRGFDCMAAYQAAKRMLGEDAVCKGMPVDSGEPVYSASCSNAFAINSMSTNKEGAWAFIEFLISTGYTDAGNYKEEPDMLTGFPVRKDKLDYLFEKCMEKVYQYDENGNILLDAEGNPKEKTQGSFTGVPYRAATQEEVDEVREIIGNIGSVYSENQTITNIISEELDSLLSGQNSPKTTAGLIQDRVQLYLDELN